MKRREVIGPGVVAADYWHRLEGGRVQCDLCPRLCTLKNGQRGFCYIREARDDGMVLTSYGRASGFCVDPIEKKPLNHFYPGTAVLSFGTAGCNLGCRFCQNWDISKARDDHRLGSSATPERVAEAALEAGCKSVAFTYNDPVIFAEYAIDTARECRARSVQTVAVTAGYITEEAREAFFAPLDAVNIDLKAFTERFYSKLCFAHLAPVLETIAWVAKETDVWLELTTLLIPGQNDSTDEVGQLCDWVAEHAGTSVPVHFSAFHPDYKMRGIPRTPAETLTRAREQARKAGLEHVYTGNVSDPAGQSTFCASCGKLLIERDWYQLGEWNLDASSACRFCGSTLSGRFDAQKGSFGPRRLRVQITD